MARNAITPGKLAEQTIKPVAVSLDRRIALGIGPFEIGLGREGRTAVTWTGHKDHVQVIVFDQPVQVNIEEVQSGRGAPMAEQSRLDIFKRQRGLQQRVVSKVDLSDG